MNLNFYRPEFVGRRGDMWRLGLGNKIFSSLDLLSGCCQVPLAPESREVNSPPLVLPLVILGGYECLLVLNLLLLLSKE